MQSCRVTSSWHTIHEDDWVFRRAGCTRTHVQSSKDNGDGEVTLEDAQVPAKGLLHRLNPKPETPDDLIAWHSKRKEFIDGILRCKGPARAIDQADGHELHQFAHTCWSFQIRKACFPKPYKP